MTRKDELSQHVIDLQNEIDYQAQELQYMADFLSWKDLWDEFLTFRTSAHLEQSDDEPFPRYVL